MKEREREDRRKEIIKTYHVHVANLFVSHWAWLRLKSWHTSNKLPALCTATRKPCPSNLYCCTTVANDYQITEECELFVIIGPLTRSAVLISRRWILPNSAKVWVVQSLWAAPRQRVKEVSWILRCRQYSASLLITVCCGSEGKPQLLRLSS